MLNDDTLNNQPFLLYKLVFYKSAMFTIALYEIKWNCECNKSV